MRKILAVAILLTTLQASVAQDYPNRALSWVVPYTAGGITDNGARFVAKVLSAKLGQPVIIDNKPGAGGIVGAEYVANSKKDGYTFLYTANGIVSYPFLFKKLSYNSERDFIPVHGFQSAPMLLMVRDDSPFRTLSDLIDYARKNPEKLNYATIGNGSVQNLLAELLQKEAGIKMTQVAYKGGAPALADLMAGVIDISFDFAVTMQPQMEAKKLRALAVSSDARLPNLPEIKTIAEQGYPGAVFTAWAAVVLPAGTPQLIVDRLAHAFGKALDDPTVVKYFNDQGAGSMQGMSKDKLKAFFDKERVKMKEIIDRSGIQPE